MNKLFSAGGVIASAILIIFGVATIVVAVTGRADVRDAIEREQITGSPDMTPEATRPALAEAGLDDVSPPSCSVADERASSTPGTVSAAREATRARSAGAIQTLLRAATATAVGRRGRNAA